MKTKSQIGQVLHLASATAMLALIAGSLLNPVWAADAPMGVERVARPTAQNYSTPAVTHDDTVCWVQVDLGRSLPIDRVKLFPHIDWGWLGQNKTQFFPSRFKVEASDDPEFKVASVIADQTGADFPNTEDAVLIFPGNRKAGRYVRLTATRLSDQKLALMKFEVWSGGSNVAEGCPAADSFKGNLGVTNLTLKRRPFPKSINSCERFHSSNLMFWSCEKTGRRAGGAP
jgi:hypothetical protein